MGTKLVHKKNVFWRILSVLLATMMLVGTVNAQDLGDDAGLGDSQMPSQEMLLDEADLGGSGITSKPGQKFLVKFNADGGKPAPADQRVEKYGTVDEPAEMTKDGYLFQGWYTKSSPNWGEKLDFNTSLHNSMTLYAKWEIASEKTYIVTFHHNDETSKTSTLSLAKGKLIPEPTDIERDGYTLVGWYEDCKFKGNPWDFSKDKMPKEDMDLYAKWDKLPTCTVTFDPKNGGNTWSEQIAKGATLDEPSAPTREDYQFLGWYQYDDDDDHDDCDKWKFNTKVQKNIKLHAHWEKLPTYTVTFDTKGGSSDPANQYLKEGEKVTKPADPTKDGSTFDGWYWKDGKNSKKWDFDTRVCKNIDLYAKWTEIKTFTVSFNADGGTPAPGSQTVSKGDKLTVPSEMTKEGYRFFGWYQKYHNNWRDEWDFSDPVESDMVLYAKWEKLAKITFKPNNGEDDWFVLIPNGEKVEEPSGITNQGRALVGWYYYEWSHGPGAVKKYWDFDKDKVNNECERILTAEWAEETIYTVTFDIDGGDDPAPSAQNLNEDDKVTKPADPTKEGHIFDGWYLEEKKWDFDSDTIAATDIILVAKWIIIKYNVTFDSVGGSSTPALQTVEHGARVAAPKPDEVTKEGYSLACWHSSPACEEETHWDFEKNTVTDHMTLYANWQEEEYTVTFYPNGGTPQPASEQIIFRQLVKMPDVTRQDFTLDGWYTTSNFAEGTEWKFASDTMPADTLNLYAKWSANGRFTVRFDTQGGSPEPDNQSLPTDSLVAAPGTVAKDGCTFDGWYTAEEGGSLWRFDQDQIGNTDLYLYARWTSLPYTVTYNGNGGGPVQEEKTVLFGDTVPSPGTVSREGFIFEGWYSDPGFAPESRWDFSSGTMPAGNLTLYAKWVAIEDENKNPPDSGDDRPPDYEGSTDQDERIDFASSGEDVELETPNMPTAAPTVNLPEVTMPTAPGLAGEAPTGKLPKTGGSIPIALLLGAAVTATGRLLGKIKRKK
ncbi:MAG: InlB B-repeat-containing protein [Oscillospiraceae bacterium]